MSPSLMSDVPISYGMQKELQLKHQNASESRCPRADAHRHTEPRHAHTQVVSTGHMSTVAAGADGKRGAETERVSCAQAKLPMVQLTVFNVAIAMLMPGKARWISITK